MKSTSQRGMALVITLMMLSVVTVMAIVFLGVARRERASVGVTGSMTDARLAADTAFARSQAEILATIATRSNLYACDFFVSTNYLSRVGFVTGRAHPTNVNYYYDTAGTLPVTGQDLYQNLANLMIDPRAPVFVTTNTSTGAKEFRYYLDVNRNGRFETNGWVTVLQNRLFQGTNYLWGDPEWVGVLERPDLPHSSSNRFIARYAYIVMPAGRSLDWNFIHNRVKRGAAPRGDFLRNQGVGSWELNLAGFLRAWSPEIFNNPPGDYRYAPESPNAPNAGVAFQMAGSFYDYRSFSQPLLTAGTLLTNAVVLRTDGFDDYADDVYQNGLPPVQSNGRDYDDNDAANVPWPPGGYPGAFYDSQDLFRVGQIRDPALPAPAYTFTNLLTSMGRDANGDTANRYAFSRLLSQIGTDSLPVSRGRVHLNYINGYWNVPAIGPLGVWDTAAGTRRIRGTPVLLEGSETNLVPWATSPRGRVDFMMLATDKILRSQMGVLFPDGLGGGIQVYPTNYYVGPTHRCVQLAANLLDTSTRNKFVSATNGQEFPSVFRPILDRWKITNEVNAVVDVMGIVGFEEVPSAGRTVAQTMALRWRDLSNPTDRQQLQPGDNVFGIPWVIGAKKGWPNFNEFYSESQVQVTRRLQATKDPRTHQITFQQSYELGITNLIGIEAWNAYSSNFPGPITLLYTNVADIVLRDGTKDNNQRTPASVVKAQNLLSVTNLVLNNWAGKQYHVFTNFLTLVPKSTFFAGRPAGSSLVQLGATAFDFVPGFPTPDFKLEVTNRFIYALTARDATGIDRVVDFVTLNPLLSGFDVNKALSSSTNRVAKTNRFDDKFWYTNRVGPIARNNIVLNNATAGITNQIYICTNDNAARGYSSWRSYSEDPTIGKQKERAIDEFRVFLGMPPLFDMRRTNAPADKVQVPFTPTRRLVMALSWMANDPLVHYHVDDLYDEKYSDTNRVEYPDADATLASYNSGLPNLGDKPNPRYHPWGPPDGRDVEADEFAYDPGVKDPWVESADDWDFTTNALPNVGWMGRVHRGTPWQTIYLKSGGVPIESWMKYMGNSPVTRLIHPTNDWFLVDSFTAAPNPNGSRGLLSVNQTNMAAWAAVLDGVRYQFNTADSSDTPGGARAATYTNFYINAGAGPAVVGRGQPDTSQLFSNIVYGINTNRLRFFGGSYRTLGDILSTPQLSSASPLIKDVASVKGGQLRISDAVLEGLPQQILGLLKSDEPYFVVYSYGQALRPADNSLVVTPGPFFHLCTNYQIMGEALTKTAFRIEERKQGTNVFYDAVTENFSVLPLN